MTRRRAVSVGQRWPVLTFIDVVGWVLLAWGLAGTFSVEETMMGVRRFEALRTEN